MRLDIDTDDRAFRRRLARVLDAGPKAVRAGFDGVARAFIRWFTPRRLSGRRGNRGLFRRTGALARGLLWRTTGSRLGSIETRIGWIDLTTARIARVHELGTVGKGGSLPDIVPVRAKLLRWQVRDGGSAVGKVLGYAYAKKVAIPPRLDFHASFRGREFGTVAQAALDEASREWTR